MISRRSFLRSLGLGVTVLALRFRLESRPVALEAPASALVGFKGRDFLETGYVYAPYMPIYVTRAVSVEALRSPSFRVPRRPMLHPAEEVRLALRRECDRVLL